MSALLGTMLLWNYIAAWCASRHSQTRGKCPIITSCVMRILFDSFSFYAISAALWRINLGYDDKLTRITVINMGHNGLGKDFKVSPLAYAICSVLLLLLVYMIFVSIAQIYQEYTRSNQLNYLPIAPGVEEVNAPLI